MHSQQISPVTWVERPTRNQKRNRQQQMNVTNYREQIDLQWSVNLSSAYFSSAQFTKWASSIVHADFFRLHFYCSFHLLCCKSQPDVSDVDAANDTVCHLWTCWCRVDMRMRRNRWTVSGHNHSEKQLKPNTGNQRQTRYIRHGCELRVTYCAGRIHKFRVC